MSDWINAVRLLHSIPLPWLLAALAVFAVQLVYFDGFCRAMEPRLGTLEWIQTYDRPALSFAGRRFACGRPDYLPLVLFSAAAAGLCAFGVVLLVRLGKVSFAEALLCPDALLTGEGGWAISLGLTLLPCYLLLRSVFGRRAVAAAGAAVLAFSLIPSSTVPSFSVPCMLLAMLFFFRFLTASSGARAGTLLLPLLLSAAFFWLAVWCDHITLWFGLGFAVLFAISLALRLCRCEMAGKTAALLLSALAAFSVLCASAICLPAAILARGMVFPNLLVQSGFWRLVLVRTLSFRIWIDPPVLLGASLLQPLIFWGGLLAMLTAAAASFTRRDTTALLVWVLYLAGLLVWIFSGSGLGAAMSVFALCFVWNGYLSRGRRAAAYGYCGICLACSAALPALLLF